MLCGRADGATAGSLQPLAQGSLAQMVGQHEGLLVSAPLNSMHVRGAVACNLTILIHIADTFHAAGELDRALLGGWLLKEECS
jgi:hypothetical protein